MKPSVSGVVGGNQPHAVRRGDDRNAPAALERGDFGSRLRQGGAVTDEEDRPLRPGDQRDGGGEILGVGARPMGAMAMRRSGGRDLRLLLEDVVGDVEIDRPRPPGDHRVEGLTQRQRQHLDPARLERPLDHRPQHLGEIGLIVGVEFLERPAIGLGGRHVGGDRQEGRGIRQRGDERHHDVGRARPGRGQRRDRAVLHPEIGVRHVAGALFVARRDQPHAVADGVERIEDAHVAVPAHAEDERHLLFDQVLGDDLATLHSAHDVRLQPIPPHAMMVIMRSSLISRTA